MRRPRSMTHPMTPTASPLLQAAAVCAVVLAVALALTGARPPAACAIPGNTVSGYLHDADSPSAPISNVVVDVYSYDTGSATLGDVVAETTTSASGHWSVVIPDGAYEVFYDPSARDVSSSSHYLKGWWAEWTDNAQPASGAAYFEVAGGPYDAGDKLLGIGTSFSGQLTGGAGTALKGAQVTAYDVGDTSNPIDSAYTDASGHYYLTVPAGTYILHYDPNVSAPTWYLPRFYGLVKDAANATAVDGILDATQALPVVNLPYGAAITGYVRQPDHSPAASVTVSAWDENGTQLGSNTTSSTGYFFLWPVEATTATVNYDPTWGPTDTSDSFNALNGTHYVLQAYNHSRLDSPTPIALGPHAWMNSADDTLSVGATLTCNVTSPSGDPLSGMTVNVAGTATSVDTLTDSSGNIVVGNLPLDSYNLYARPEAYDNAHSADYVATSYDSNPVLVDTETVVAAPDPFVVQLGGRVTGRVTDAGVTPLAGVDVSAITADGNDAPAHGLVDGAGNYVIHGIPSDYASGRMKVGFSAYDWNQSHATQYIDEYWNAKSTFRTADVITVVPETTIPGVNAKLARGSVIRGKITGPGGGALSTALVELHNVLDDPRNSVQMTYTDPSGNYQFIGVAPGIYKIDSSYDDGVNAYPTRFYSNKGNWAQASSIAVSAGSTLSGRNIALADGAVLGGKVTVEGNTTPLADVTVDIVDDATGYVWTSTQTQGDGSWQTQVPSYIAPGSYKIMFDPKQTNSDLGTHYALRWYRSGTPTSADEAAGGTSVAVTYNSNVTGLNGGLSEANSVSISGRIVARGTISNPYVAGMDPVISAYAQVDGEWRPVSWTAVDHSLGTFTVSGLPAGKDYKLCFDDADRSSTWGTYSTQFWVSGGFSAGSVSWPEVATTITPATSVNIGNVPIQKSGLFVIKTYDAMTDDPLENSDVFMQFHAPDGSWWLPGGTGYAGYTMASGELDVPSEGNGAAIDVGLMPGEYRFRFERFGYDTAWFEDATSSAEASTVALTSFDPVAFTPTWVEQNLTPSDLSSGTVQAQDRYGVGATLMREAFPGLTGITDVVVASGVDRSAADPLSAAGLAGVYHAPLVLINQDRSTLPKASAQLLHDIAAANPSTHINVKIVGGTASVPDRFRSQLVAALGGSSHAGTVARFGGSNRYQVAAGVAAHVRARTGVSTCFLVNGSSPLFFWDALTVSPVAFGKHYPILLVTGSTVPGPTNSEQSHYAYKYVIGNTTHVAEAVRSALGADRITGGTRADTAARFSETAWDRGWLDLASVSVGNKLADSLAGGVAYGAKGGPLLYTGNGATTATSLDPSTRQFFINYRDHVTNVELLGGPGSIDQTHVMPQVMTALGR